MKPEFRKPETPLVVYTDLDGTLLDHDSYHFQPALPALQRLQELGVPVIPVTSKTLAELESLTRQLNLAGPCIAENGALIAYPSGYFLNLEDLPSIGRYRVERCSPAYPTIVASLQQLRKQGGFRFESFSDMNISRVCETTGLGKAEASLAKHRLGSEPLLWKDTEQAFERFSAELAKRQYCLLRGGRFWHVLGETDKAAAIRRLNSRFEAAGYHGYTSIALGDSPNDIPMLQATDIAVVIRRKDGTHMHFEEGANVFRTRGTGPEGWNEFFQAHLDKLSSGAIQRTRHG